jgi:hypothetical protein
MLTLNTTAVEESVRNKEILPFITKSKCLSFYFSGWTF